MNKAAFLDRDGVINQKAKKGEYITRWDEVRFLPGVAEAINLLHVAGFVVIVVTNQRCVAKGLMTIAELENMHQLMRDELMRAGSFIDAIYYCPHEYHHHCSCRKPAPGMLFQAAEKYDVDLRASWMIGDSEIDVAAGKNAGCRTARLLGQDEVAKEDADISASDLLGAVQKILQRQGTIAECQMTDTTRA